jgi:ABC-type sulfate transport system permease component
VYFVSAYPETAPVAVYKRFTSVGVIQTAPLVSMLILFSVALFFVLQLISKILPGSEFRKQTL